MGSAHLSFYGVVGAAIVVRLRDRPWHVGCLSVAAWEPGTRHGRAEAPEHGAERNWAQVWGQRATSAPGQRSFSST
jgi:hypothetical protein